MLARDYDRYAIKHSSVGRYLLVNTSEIVKRTLDLDPVKLGSKGGQVNAKSSSQDGELWD
jgi:hypothetical protein